ncbi:TonB-dependent receptor [Marinibaculum pumilum]|uniref:TonB-dependent receptor n=1 Tax=Marinibaculum pumilum TaxID=1766165 RepID=A0ABV7L838_9PROT
MTGGTVSKTKRSASGETGAAQGRRTRPALRRLAPLAITPVAAGLAALGLTVATLPLPALAQSQTGPASTAQAQFDIAPQPLGDALAAFGRQAGVQVSVHGDLARGKSSPGVRGRMDADAALQRLLSGSGLTWRRAADGTVILEAAAQGASGATVLDPIMIEGAGAGSADDANAIEIGQDELELLDPTNLKEVYAGQAAVSVGGGIPVSQKVYVNGVEETNLAVTVDGARQNNKVFHHTGTNLIDPSMLKSVRVDPGVAPADAGPGALGGAIVYETVDAGDMLLPGRNLGGFANGSYGTNGGTYIADLAAYGRAQGFEALGYFKYGEGGNYSDGNGLKVEGTETSLRSFLAKTAYEGAGGHRIELSGQQVRDDADRPFRANIGQLTNRPGPIVRNYNLRNSTYSLNYSTPHATGLFDPSLVVGYSEQRTEVLDPFGSIGITGGWNGKLENDFNLSPRDRITVGTDFYSSKAQYKDPTTNVQETATNVGIYAQARLVPVDPLRLSFGLRGDRQWFKGVDGTKLTNSGASGNISAAYDVADFLTLSAGYSNVWGGIALAENYILNPAWTYASGIKPVRSQNGVVDAEVRYMGFTFRAGLFESRFSNARDESFRGGPDLTADFKTRGYNLGAGYAWQSGFARLTFIDSRISLNGAVTDSDATQYLGTPIGRVFALEAAQRFDSIGVTVGGTAQAALKNSETADAGFQPQDPYKVLNLFGEYRPAQLDFLTLRLDVKNVFDEAYADRATYGQEFSTVRPLMEPGRSFMVSAKARF